MIPTDTDVQQQPDVKREPSTPLWPPARAILGVPDETQTNSDPVLGLAWKLLAMQQRN